MLTITVTNLQNCDNPTYKWYRNGVLIVGETGDSITVTEGGLYCVTVTCDNGCFTNDCVNVGNCGDPDQGNANTLMVCD